MTPQQLAEELERRVAELRPSPDEPEVLDPSVVSATGKPVTAGVSGKAVAPPVGPVGMERRETFVPHPVDDSLRPLTAPMMPVTAPAQSPVDMVTRKPSVQQEQQAEEKPAAAPAAASTETEMPSLYDLIMRNDAVRERNREAFDRREKSDRARLAIAAVTDALASLGNLVGTTQGAFNQPQTYQVPFVQADVEKARGEARKYADLLDRNDQAIRLQMHADERQKEITDRQLAIQELISERADKRDANRAALQAENIALRRYIAEMQDATRRYTTDENNATRREVAAGNNATSRANTASRNATSKEVAEIRAANSGVNGYTTTETETVKRDDLGNVTEREKTKTRTANGQTTTTTKTEKSKTPPSKQKKEEKDKKTPPSRRK